MHVVIVYLDDDGLEYYREKLPEDVARKLGYGEIIDEMIKEGARFRQVGDKIIELTS